MNKDLFEQDFKKEEDNNIDICNNCINYHRKSQQCKIKDKQMHETQTCNQFNIDTERDLLTKEEIRDEQKINFLREEVYKHVLKNERDKTTELIAKEFLDRNIIKVTRDDNKPEFYIYREGIYIPEGRTYIEEFSRKVLGVAYTKQLTNDIVAKIQADCKVEFKEFLDTNHPYEIPVQNGILNLKTGNLKAFNPEKYFFNKLPITYNPKAKCPKIINFLTGITKSSTDLNLIIELFGFALAKDHFIEQAFMLVGKTRNGKTKLLELLENFVGKENTCSVALQQLNRNSDSRVRELHNRQLNLAGDLDNTSFKDVGLFKDLTGRGQIQAGRKYQRDIIFRNYAKLIFACNELPKIYNIKDDAIWERWILIEFPYKFVDNPKTDFEKKKDPEIINKIVSKEELSGLLNLALQGLKRIIENKRFSYSVSSEEVKKKWIRLSDSFAAYCMDNIVEADEGRIEKSQLRKFYAKYCKNHKARLLNDKYIKHYLETTFAVQEVREDNYGSWNWSGIDFKK